MMTLKEKIKRRRKAQQKWRKAHVYGNAWLCFNRRARTKDWRIPISYEAYIMCRKNGLILGVAKRTFQDRYDWAAINKIAILHPFITAKPRNPKT